MCLISACLHCHGNFNLSLCYLTVCFKLASKLRHREAHNLILSGRFGDLYGRLGDDSGRLPDNPGELACMQLGPGINSGKRAGEKN